MHEVGIAMEVVALATESSAGRRIARIELEIGRLAAILPDAVRFCFDMVAEGTAAEGATLDIREIPAKARCRGCNGTHELAGPLALCPCGGTDLEWLSGEELRIRKIEVV